MSVLTKEGRQKELARLGQAMLAFERTDDFLALADLARSENGWFTEANCRMAWLEAAQHLTEGSLATWTENYALAPAKPRQAGVIAAGNLPLVGWADVLAVLASGHSAQVKLSSQDQVLMKAMFGLLAEVAPNLAKHIEVKERLADFEAVIATGGNNSARYFEAYFGKYPHIIRRNRNSLAILTGEETKKELEGLGADVFHYFGLGCRSVSCLLLPDAYDIGLLATAWLPYTHLADHAKYANNLDYHRALFLLNQDQFWDMGLVLLRPENRLYSPLAVLNIVRYSDEEAAKAWIAARAPDIQVVVGDNRFWPTAVPFGQSQFPQLWDYADGVNTLAWLDSLA